jgi:membrane protein DedA with SNARE-associated domain
VVLVAVAAVWYAATSDGFDLVNVDEPWYSYLAVFGLVALDGVIPIFPGETTLNAASTAAAQGALELTPVIVMGALGAIAGDSTLFWLARRWSARIQSTLDRARANNTVQQALEVMDSSAPVLILGGRYVPGMRFVVSATMGLSRMSYLRFLPWSVLGGALWSTYTCLLAYQIGLALGEFPLASVVISGLITTVVLTIILFALRRQRRAHLAAAVPAADRVPPVPTSEG